MGNREEIKGGLSIFEKKKTRGRKRKQQADEQGGFFLKKKNEGFGCNKIF